MKILVVDDEELLVKGIRFNLQNDGYQVVTGSNGREAIELARDPDIRLIVLDVMMPEVDGLTACRTIGVTMPRSVETAIFLSSPLTATYPTLWALSWEVSKAPMYKSPTQTPCTGIGTALAPAGK